MRRHSLWGRGFAALISCTCQREIQMQRPISTGQKVKETECWTPLVYAPDTQHTSPRDFVGIFSRPIWLVLRLSTSVTLLLAVSGNKTEPSLFPFSQKCFCSFSLLTCDELIAVQKFDSFLALMFAFVLKSNSWCTPHFLKDAVLMRKRSPALMPQHDLKFGSQWFCL